MWLLKRLLGLLVGISVWQLPGSAQALPSAEIRACRQIFSGVEGTEVYRCFDAAGHPVSEAPVAGYLARSGWSQAQLQAYLKAFENPCAFRARLEELDSPLLRLLRPERLSGPVCYNIDRSRVSFSYDGANYLHQTDDTPGGGNARGAYWTLTVTGGPLTLIRRTEFAFLACQRFRARRENAWQLEIVQTAEQYTLKADNVSFPNRTDFNWQTELQALNESFSACL